MGNKILKLVAYALVFGALAGTTLTSCGDKKKSNALTKIELWYGATSTEAGPPPADWKALDIIKEKLGIELVLAALPSNEQDANTKINASAAANTLPDLFMVSRDTLSRLVPRGVLAPVDDLYGMMPNRTSKMYDKQSIAMTTFNGHSYGLAQPGAIIKNEGILIRKDWLEKLGLSVPVTLDDYFNVMKAFTFNDPDGNGRDDTYGFGAFLEVRPTEEGLGRRFMPFFGAYGVAGTWNLTKDAAGLNIKKPGYFDALSFVRKMQDEKVIDPNWVSYKKDDFRAAWKKGKFGIMREQNAAYGLEGGYTPFDKNFPDGEWIVIDPPVGPTGQSAVGNYSVGYRIYAVSKKAADAGKKAKIAELLEWMSSDEGYMLLGYGEEGVNYVIGADGIPTTDGIPDASKGYTKPEMLPLTQLRNMVFYNGDTELKSRYPTWYTSKGREMSALATLRIMQSKAWTPTIGDDTLPTPSADLDRLYQQSVQEFITGKRELTKENWNAWLNKFCADGGDQWEKDGIDFARSNNLLQ